MLDDVLRQRRVSGHLPVRKRTQPRLRRAVVRLAHADANGRQVVDEKIHPVIGRDHNQHIGACGVDAPAQFRERTGQRVFARSRKTIPTANDHRPVTGRVDADEFSHV